MKLRYLIKALISVLIFASSSACVAQTPDDAATKKERDQRLEAAIRRLSQQERDGSAKYHGAGVGAAVLSPEVLAYQRELHRIVKSHFRWAKDGPHFVAKVLVDVATDGKLSNVQIQQSSGNPDFDRAALEAVQNCNPFPTPPAKDYDRFKKIRFALDSQQD